MRIQIKANERIDSFGLGLSRHRARIVDYIICFFVCVIHSEHEACVHCGENGYGNICATLNKNEFIILRVEFFFLTLLFAVHKYTNGERAKTKRAKIEFG